MSLQPSKKANHEPAAAPAELRAGTSSPPSGQSAAPSVVLPHGTRVYGAVIRYSFDNKHAQAERDGQTQAFESNGHGDSALLQAMHWAKEGLKRDMDAERQKQVEFIKAAVAKARGGN